jgi:hypothetical protein
MQSVAPEENVVRIPKGEEHRETNGEGYKAAHDFVQAGKILGDFEGDDEQGECESEYNVAESVDARHSDAAHAETIFDWLVIGRVHENSPGCGVS